MSREDFDRTSRHTLVARAIRALADPPGPILDVGGSDSVLADLLPSYDVLPVDIRGSDVVARASATALPFPAGAAAVAVAIDVLEHVPRAQRSACIGELTRVATSGVIVAGPTSSPSVIAAEAQVNDLYRRLTGRSYRWLDEHLDFGLPALGDIERDLETHGFVPVSVGSNPVSLWTRLMFANFVGAETGDASYVSRAHESLLERFLDTGDAEEPSYRRIVIASRTASMAQAAVVALRPGTGQTPMAVDDAVATLDDAVARTIGETLRESRRLGRLSKQQSERIDTLNTELRHGEHRRQVLDQRLRHEAEQSESARAALSVAQASLTSAERGLSETRSALEGSETERSRIERELSQVRAAREAAEARLERRRKEATQLAAIVRTAQRDVDRIASSRRWRVGGMVTAPTRFLRRRSREDAVTRLRRDLARGSAKNAKKQRVPNGRPGRGRGKASATAKDTTSTKKLRKLAAQVDADARSVTTSRRWRVGRAALTPIRIVRRHGPSAADRIRQRADQPYPRDPALLIERIEAQVADAIRIEQSTAYRIGGRVIALAPTGSRRAGTPATKRLKQAQRKAKKLLASPGAATRRAPKVNPDRAYRDYRRLVEAPALESRAPAEPTTTFVILDSGQVRDREHARTATLGGLAQLGATPVWKHRGRDAIDADDIDWRRLRRTLDDIATPYVAFLRLGDVPSKAFSVPSDCSAAAVLFDWDCTDTDGTRTNPWFHLGFSPDLIAEIDTVSSAVAFRLDALVPLDDIDSTGFHRDAILQMHAAQHEVICQPGIALHTLHAPPRGVSEADQSVAHRHAARLHGSMVRRRHDRVRIEHRSPSASVSVIIPTRDRADLLEVAVSSLLRLTLHDDFEIIVVDNDSAEDATRQLFDSWAEDGRVRVIDYPGHFNYSKANNLAAEHATGDVLIFLNNDTRVLAPDWMTLMAGQARRPEIGAVGAKLLFADGSLQHNGVVVGMQGFAAHLLRTRFAHDIHPALADHARNVSAVTAACLAVDADLFRSVGGFDESFELTGNDVEFCLRLLRAGYSNVVEPDAVLFHYEKQTRHAIETPLNDKLRSLELYEPYLSEGDPYFNSELSLSTTDVIPRSGENPSVHALKDATLAEVPKPKRRATAYLTTYDANAELLERNRSVIASRPSDAAIRTMTWFLPSFDHVYRGGIYTILRVAEALRTQHNVTSRIALWGADATRAANVRSQIETAFPALQPEIQPITTVEDVDTLPLTDAGVATLWTTAYSLLRFDSPAKFYFVQDYEPAFEPANEIFGLIEQTYRFGFTGLCNTQGVADAYAAYGSPAIPFTPGIDERFRSAADDSTGRADGPIRIVFYGRPTNPRNGFELGIEALREVKRRHGARVEIVSAGAVWEPHAYGLAGVVDNLGVLPDIEAVASLYRSCDIGLVFMFTKHPSYQPLEYMASGCATVTNFNEANLWLLEDGENCVLVPPLLTAVADAIDDLVHDAPRRDHIRLGGLRTASTLDWSTTIDDLARRIVVPLEDQ